MPAVAELLGREAREGREAVAQRALSSLMLGHQPRRWNEPDAVTARGRDFIGQLDAAAYGAAYPGAALLVDEFELPGRHAEERAGWPDFAVLWEDRVLLVELKAEIASHTPGQCERYLALGRHHHPRRRVDLVYLTPTMPSTTPAGLPEGCLYAHLTWAAVLPLATAVWGDSAHGAERELVAFLGDYLPGLDRPRPPRACAPPEPAAAPAREGSGSPPLSKPAPGPVPDAVLRTAILVQCDGRQRGVDLHVHDPEELDAMRIGVRELLRTGPVVDGTGITHVQPWIWKAGTSGGRPLTEAGSATGYELRLSRYAAPFADAPEPTS
ncbi:hypothetical protein [Streptomyces sp. NPDC002758]